MTDGRRPPDAGDVLRDLPARRLPALLLPLARGARPARSAPTSSTSTRSRGADIFWVTGTGLCQEPCRAAHHGRAARRAAGRRLDGARPRLPADVLAVAGEAHAQVCGRRCRTSTSPSATSRSARSRSASATRERAADALLDAGVDLAVVKQGPAGVLARDRDGAGRGAAGRRSRSSTGSAPATPSAARCATGCWPAGRWSGSCASPTRPAPSSPSSWPARRRDADHRRGRGAARPERAVDSMSERLAGELVEAPGPRAPAARSRRPLRDAGRRPPARPDRPADAGRRRPPGPRRARASATGPLAMADRAELLDRLLRRAGPPRRRRRARHPGRPGGPAAARRAGRQGRHRLDEPRRPARHRVRDRRPVHRRTTPTPSRRWASTAARCCCASTRRPGHGAHPGGLRATRSTSWPAGG